MKKLLVLSSIIAIVASMTLGQDKFKLDTDKITVAVNSPKIQEAKVVATAATPDTFDEGATITWTGQENFLTVTSTLSNDRKKITSVFKAVAPTPALKLTAKIGTDEFSQSVTAAVLPEVSASTVRLSVPDDEKASGITLTIGGPRQFRFSLSNGAEIPASALTVKSDNDSVATATLQGDILTIRGVSAGPTNIKIFGYGDPIGNLQINAAAGIDLSAIPSKIVINRNDPKPIELKDALKVDLAKLIISAPLNQEIATINAQNQLIGLKPGEETTFKVTVKDVPDRSKDITVAVKAKTEKIVASIPLNNKSLVKGMATSFTLTVEGDGQESNNVSVDLSSSNSECVSVAKSSRNNFTIRAEKDSCSVVTLTATATAEGLSSPLTAEFKIVPFSVTNFALIKIRLDVMDDQTAKDLFGKKANDEYIIAKVRLFNAIGRGDANFGKSILVYSESLEVKVGVEWREVGGSGDNAQWRTLDEDTARNWFNEAQLTAPSTNRNCATIEQPNLFVPYRPLTFDIVSNTHERRDARSLRSKLFLALNGFSTLASVVTSVAVPAAGNDIPLGLDKFRNLLIPGIEKLFPSMKEVQRQNITSMVMKPLEEVPFGSDITRILFFPRRAIKGVLVNLPNGTAKRTELRISAVSSSDSCAEVGVIDKVNSTSNQ